MLVRADPGREDDLAALAAARPLVPIRCPAGSRSRRRSTPRSSTAASRARWRPCARSPGSRSTTSSRSTSAASGSSSTSSAASGWTSTAATSTTTAARTGYATIDLQPGYQRLTGLRALDFVRYRHTDSDFYRNARQQQFVRALKDQVESSFSLLRLPQVIKVVTTQRRGGSGWRQERQPQTVRAYAALAYTLPPGHIFQARLEGLEGLRRPDHRARERAACGGGVREPGRRVAPEGDGRRARREGQAEGAAANQTTVTVLNGNGVTGSASSANYLLSQRGYGWCCRPTGIPANAPSFDFFRTTVFFDPPKPGAKPAAREARRPVRDGRREAHAGVRPLANGAMLVAVRRPDVPRPAGAGADRQDPGAAAAESRAGHRSLSRPAARAPVGDRFPLMVPTVVERSSWIDSERPLRSYYFDQKRKRNKTIRLTYKLGGGTSTGACSRATGTTHPCCAGETSSRRIGGRYELHYQGSHLHMVVLRSRARRTGSSTRCSTGSRTRRCSRSRRACARSRR